MSQRVSARTEPGTYGVRVINLMAIPYRKVLDYPLRSHLPALVST